MANLGVTFLCLATIAWGGMFPAAKIALASLDPVTITFVRYFAVSLVLIPFVWGRHGAGWNRAGLAGAALGGVIGIAGFNVLMLYGLQHTTPERAAVVMALLPLVTGILRWLIGEERLKALDVVCLSTASLGIFLLVSHGDSSEIWRGSSGGGELMVVGGVVCWACYTIITSRVRSLTAMQYTFAATAAGSLCLAPILAMAEIFGWSAALTISSFKAAAWPLAYMITLGGAVAIFAWSKGVRLVGSLNAALFINLIPITAFVIGIAAGHSIVTTDLLGGSLVILSLIVHNVVSRSSRTFFSNAPKEKLNALR